MKLVFIGGGNMASAMIGGLLKQGWPAADIAAVDISAEARDRLSKTTGVRTFGDLAEGLADAECIVFAVKPQQLRDTARAVAPLLNGRLVLTIAAGIRSGDLARWLGGHERIVRAMPNTPALVLAGMSGLYARPGVGGGDRDAAQRILGAAGNTLWLESEDQIDGVTAVSGSGPAYVFYFLEALEDAARAQGFDPAAARELALHTVAGAVKLATESSETPAVLRARVTSKGGTTERGIAVLEARSMKQIMNEAVAAAASRSRELGDELGANE
ncbi:MAG: pyrroline-5-carboxylate reductase [Rhodospirillaceae bacterium]